MQSTNFEFLRPENETLANLAGLAEAVIHIDAGSALTRLRGFAEEVTKAIYKEERLTRIPQAQFYDLVERLVYSRPALANRCVNPSNRFPAESMVTKQPTAAEGELRNAQMAMGTAHQLGYVSGHQILRQQKDRHSLTYQDLSKTQVARRLKQLKTVRG